ncbi:hypothetical protein TOPH_08081, partial [Tolypocladium ophioglossoides CBS 100239]
QAQLKVQARDKTGPSTAAEPLTDAQAQSQAQVSETPHFHGYSLSPDTFWIKWNGHNALWLSPDYRPYVSAISPSTATLALVCPSRRVLVIGFSPSGPSNGYRNQL